MRVLALPTALLVIAGTPRLLCAEERPVPRTGDPSIAEALGAIVIERHVPALAGAIVTSAGALRIGIAGWRKRGDATPAAVDDQWHLGSDAKAMTAVLAARLIERGALRWDSTVAAVLPEAGPAWGAVTLDHLLAHRGGIPGEPDYHAIADRAAAVRAITARPPAPGAGFAYSNSGYVLAGAMLERATGKAWEDLIRTEVWGPLGMDGCGFGGMGTTGQVDQPWGHLANGEPAGNGPRADNPPAMGPAGTVHMPMRAWAAFIADQLKGARGEPALLTAASYRHLQSPWPAGEHARGWVVLRRAWAHGDVLTHSGSNTTHLAVVWVAPAIDRAVLVCCNQGDSDAACDEAAVALLKIAGDLP